MLSVVVPVFNEAENIAPLVSEITALAARVPIMEIVYVNDGSTDGTVAELRRMQESLPMLRIITLSPRAGQSAATWAGVQAATQPLIVTLDGDGQNDPEGMVDMFKTFMDVSQRTPRLMVAGQRTKREDNFLRIVSSRIANKIRAGILKDGVSDTGCALKMFRRDDYLALPYFNHMHRYLPALMMRHGVAVALSPVHHRPRTRGVSKYGILDRAFVGIIDLFGVRWLQARALPAALKSTEEHA